MSDSSAPDPHPLLQIGMAFTSSRVLLTAIELDLFTVLSRAPMRASEIAETLSLHKRAVPDFFDALVALSLLNREGDGPDAKYSNAPLPAYYLVKGIPSYRGSFLEMCATRLYSYWGHLTEALQTGRCQNESHPRNAGSQGLWDSMYHNDSKIRAFIQAMAASGIDAHRALAQNMDWTNVKSHLDVGGADGLLPCEVVAVNPHVQSITLDLEPVSKIAREYIEGRGLSKNITVKSGSFWECSFPKVDVITMGRILHDYDIEKKLKLLKKAYNSLKTGGRFVALERLIENDRRGSVESLTMSLNMIIDQEGGFNFTASEFDGWAKDVGFVRTERIELTPPMSAVIAFK